MKVCESVDKEQVLQEVNKVFAVEMAGLQQVRQSLDESIVEVIQKINNCKGRVILTGMGKSGHICRKIAATMASIGIHAYFMHPGEGLHGDLGSITKEDLVLAVSNGGESDEIVGIIPVVQKIGADLCCIVGRRGSALEKFSSAAIVYPPVEEAFLPNLVPTTTTTAELVIGDAIAVAVSKMRGFSESDFAIYHPNGLLGKKMTTRVRDLMRTGPESNTMDRRATVKDALFAICEHPTGGVMIADKNNQLLGLLTDGDIRRTLATKPMDLGMPAEEIMTRRPYCTEGDILVVDLVEQMRTEGKIRSIVPVLEDSVILGLLCLTDITREGLV